jgi:hypothetical protein
MSDDRHIFKKRMAIVLFLHEKTVFFNQKIKIVASSPNFAAFVTIFSACNIGIIRTPFDRVNFSVHDVTGQN